VRFGKIALEIDIKMPFMTCPTAIRLFITFSWMKQQQFWMDRAANPYKASPHKREKHWNSYSFREDERSPDSNRSRAPAQDSRFLTL
jgi:hypothetical protein